MIFKHIYEIFINFARKMENWNFPRQVTTIHTIAGFNCDIAL